MVCRHRVWCVKPPAVKYSYELVGVYLACIPELEWLLVDSLARGSNKVFYFH
jgi:hypothetical protein